MTIKSRLKMFKFFQTINMISCFLNLFFGLLLINSTHSPTESLVVAGLNALAWFVSADAIEKLKAMNSVDDNGEPVKVNNEDRG